MSKTINISDLYTLIESRLRFKKRLIIAIDGKACSGKTTLSEHLKEKYNATIIHLDDFYKPRNKLEQVDLTLNEGNIDYLRFIKEIINNLDKSSLDYIKFNCFTQKKESPIKLELTNIIIIEGTYSLNPRLNEYYDFSIFYDLDEKSQFERIKKRNKDNYSYFISTWVKLETNYFNTFKIKENSDYILID